MCYYYSKIKKTQNTKNKNKKTFEHDNYLFECFIQYGKYPKTTDRRYP